MKEYICGIVGAALVVSVALLVLPDDASAREVRLLGTLALICVIAAPLAGAAGRVRELFESGIVTVPDVRSDTDVPDELIAALERQSAGEIGEALRETVCRQFDLAAEDVEVRVRTAFADGKVTLERVYVIFTGRAMWQDPRPVKEYVESVAGAPCDVSEG